MLFLGKKEAEKQPVCSTGNITELRIFLCASISFCPWFSFAPVVLSQTCGEYMVWEMEFVPSSQMAKSLPKEGSAYAGGGGQCSPHPSFEWLWPHSRLKSQKEKVQRVPNKQIWLHAASRNFWTHLSKSFSSTNQHCTTHQERIKSYSIEAAGGYVGKTNVITRAHQPQPHPHPQEKRKQPHLLNRY